MIFTILISLSLFLFILLSINLKTNNDISKNTTPKRNPLISKLETLFSLNIIIPLTVPKTKNISGIKYIIIESLNTAPSFVDNKTLSPFLAPILFGVFIIIGCLSELHPAHELHLPPQPLSRITKVLA